MTEQQQAAWIYTWERIALVQTILNGGAAALVAALKAEESSHYAGAVNTACQQLAFVIRAIESILGC